MSLVSAVLVCEKDLYYHEVMFGFSGQCHLPHADVHKYDRDSLYLHLSLHSNKLNLNALLLLRCILDVELKRIQRQGSEFFLGKWNS